MDNQINVPNVPVEIPPVEPVKNTPSFRRKAAYSVIGVLFLVAIAAYWWDASKQEATQSAQNDCASGQEDCETPLEITGSEEYKQYIESIDKLGEQWVATESQMKAGGSSKEDIELAKRDFFEFFASTLLLKIKFEGTTMSDREKLAIGNKLQQLAKDINIDQSVDPGCEYTEQKLPVQDFLVGVSLKFKKPMVYVEWPEEQEKYCSPIMSSTRYWIQSTVSLGSLAFDKRVKTHLIDPSTTFTLEGRIKLHNRGLFSEGDRDHYILKDSKGEVTVPAFFYIFDQDYKGDTADDGEIGSELYKDGKLVGHVVSDIRSGGVWIQGTQVPQDVIDANTPEIPTSFPTATSKRTEFMQRVAVAVDEGKIVNYTSQEIIKADLGKDLYTYKDGEVINDFGGKITIKKNGDKVSVIFDKIPKGEDCYQFYYINDPSTYGFKESHINGVLESYSGGTSKDIEDFKQKVCFPANGTATIEFRGNIDDIRNAALWIKKRYDPTY